jgi:uncharacterized protein YndB with AHSA1/START domain
MFEVIVIIAVVLAIAIAVVLILAATKPDTLRVQRAITVSAPAEKIFPLINDFHQWRTWSPYEHKDPAMKRTYSGAESGKGAVYAWDGNNNVGSGRMEILETSAPSKIRIKLDFFQAVRRPQHRRIHNAAAGRCYRCDLADAGSGRLHVQGDAGVHQPRQHDRQGF